MALPREMKLPAQPWSPHPCKLFPNLTRPVHPCQIERFVPFAPWASGVNSPSRDFARWIDPFRSIARAKGSVLYADNAKRGFSGIVYHANYLRFMERGRTNHLRLMGAEQHALFAEAQAETPGFAFVVRSMRLDFLKPARMDDVLDVVTWPLQVKGASITLAQEVRRGEHLLVKAQVRVAFISEGKAQPIPKALRILMKADQV